MTDVVKLVDSASSDLNPVKLTLPPPLLFACAAIQKTHRLWRWYRRGKLYARPDNFLKLAAGHGMCYAFGDSTLLRLSAISLLIATRILEAVEQKTKLQKSWERLTWAWHGHYETPLAVSWEARGAPGLLSISTVIWWKTNGCLLYIRIERIALCTFKVGKEAFILSMKVMDAVDTFSLSPANGNEGMDEFFVNGSLWMDRMVENKELMIEGLKANSLLIDKILQGIHSPFNSQQLIAAAVQALDTTAAAQKATDKACTSAGDFAVALVKKWGYEFMWNLNLHHLAPRSLIPPKDAPWEKPPHMALKERFPPEELVTKPSRLPPPVLHVAKKGTAKNIAADLPKKMETGKINPKFFLTPPSEISRRHSIKKKNTPSAKHPTTALILSGEYAASYV